MFDTLTSAHTVSKDDFKKEEPKLRQQLIEAQLDLLESGEFPVIITLSGLDAPGRSAAAKQLLSWMDPRHIRPYASLRPSEEDLQRPRMWRFWRELPPKGQIGIFLTAWYERPIRDCFVGRISEMELREQIDQIVRFEEMLAYEGALFLKFLFLLPEEEHGQTIKKIAKDPTIAWKISDDEVEISKEFAKHYDRAQEIVEDVVGLTSKAYAPWIPLPSADRYYRDLTIGKALIGAIGERLKAPENSVRSGVATRAAVDVAGPNLLDGLDLSQSMSKSDYRAALKKEQLRLTKRTLAKKFEDRSLVMVFEGNDAAGKGGAIRRVVQALDPRMMRIIPVAAPSDEEKAQHYLWRFWRRLPSLGNIAIFDRSWYGRVLVERVEGFCSESDWMYAYDEIRTFERELAESGVILVKFWLAIDQDEQLQRFEAREATAYKQYKITDEDWRNRKKWNAYKEAVHDMVLRTGTSQAPWTLVEANDKYFARVKVLKTINRQLEDALGKT
ncbi:MAG: polyphosphate:AMP phosphotransferase [Pseudomonadota bacterium]